MIVANFGTFGRNLVGDGAPLGAGGLGRLLGEGGGDEGRDDPAAALAGMGQHVPHEVDATALPGGRQHLGDGGLQAFMGIGDDELDATQAATGQLAQELRPDRFGFRGADLQAQNLAPAGRIDGNGDDRGDRDDAAAAAYLQVSRWSRRRTPYRLSAAGFSPPLAEPDVRSFVTHPALQKT